MSSKSSHYSVHMYLVQLMLRKAQLLFHGSTTQKKQDHFSSKLFPRKLNVLKEHVSCVDMKTFTAILESRFFHIFLLERTLKTPTSDYNLFKIRHALLDDSVP